MTTHTSWGRRLLGAAVAVPMALAGMVVGASTALADVATEHLVAAYDFTERPTDGSTVPNTATESGFGDAVVQGDASQQWRDSALTLTGGSKSDANATWVRLPDNLLAGKTNATVTMEVKADPSMLNAFHFLWSIGAETAGEGNVGQYLFASLNCGSGRSPLTGIKANGTETLVQSSGCVVQGDQWLSVTSRIANGEARLYINGQRVASGAVPSSTADITDQTMNAIARSPWPDNYFKGQVSTFRVYDEALPEAEIQAISDADAAIHADELTGALLDGIEVPTSVDGDYVALPTADGQITWESSDESVITTDGMVTQPSKSEPAVTVTLTAHATVRGQTATKAYQVAVQPSDKSDDELLDAASDRYVIPSVVRSGDRLPEAPAGMAVTVEDVEGVSVTDGVITADGDAETTGAVTVAVSKDGLPGSVSKRFEVTVLPESGSSVLAAYDRSATSDREANNGDIAYSMHLAKRNDDGTFTPYNENYGIFFPRLYQKLPLLEDTKDWSRSLKDPSLFYREDGGFGVVAVRTNRGTATADARGTILVATSEDLLSYDEREDSGSIIEVGETNGVNKPHVVWDSAANQYVVSWTDDNGMAKYTTFVDLDGKESQHGDVFVGNAPVTGVLTEAEGIEDFRSGATIAVRDDIAEALDVRFARITNTGYEAFDDVTVEQGADLSEADLPKTVTLDYSDGSSRSLPIERWDTSAVDTSVPGEYTVTAKVKQTDYQIPFAEDRADPSVYKWAWTHEVDGKEVTETKFLMIATNDIYGDCTWQHGTPHMPFRMADTIEGLADNAETGDVIDANGYNPKEHVLLSAGVKDSEGQPIMHSFWAPEIHEINGNLTVLFMAGYGNQWSNGKAVYMQLKKDANGYDLDPTDPANWTTPIPIYRPDGAALATTASGGVGMSLDMTYFQDADGQSYYAWQQLGATYIARMDPSNPARTTSYPVRIVAPEYAWNVTIAEGPNVTMRDGKLYLMFSGSAVGVTYTTGLAVADASGSDLTDPASWTVLNYPIQKSGPFNGAMQLGTGHGMWSEDEDGNQIYVFHAYADQHLGGTNATGRDMFVRRVHWASDGYPVFDMSLDEELDPNTVVSLTVRVGQVSDPSDSADPSDPSDTDQPSAGQSSDTHADKPGNSVAATGSAIVAVVGAVVVLLAAGISLVMWRKRRG